MTRRSFQRLLLFAAAFVIAVPVMAQAQDTWIGTWKLNLAKSKYDPASLTPKSQTIKQEALASGGFKATVEGVDAQGKPIHQENTTMFDGKASEIKGAPDANTTTARTVVAADGKTRTITTTTGKNAQGQTINNVAFYDRQ